MYLVQIFGGLCFGLSGLVCVEVVVMSPEYVTVATLVEMGVDMSDVLMLNSVGEKTPR